MKPFTNGASALNELVLKITSLREIDYNERVVCENLVCEDCHKAIAEMVSLNTSLLKLKLWSSYSSDDGCAIVGNALGENHSLQEFGFPCSVAGLRELMRALSGTEGKSSLTNHAHIIMNQISSPHKPRHEGDILTRIRACVR